MPGKQKGFSYYVEREKIKRYRAWPVERRLKWLYYGNKLRKSLPTKTIAIQDAFRRGKI
jgi:hypothetical protein